MTADPRSPGDTPASLGGNRDAPSSLAELLDNLEGDVESATHACSSCTHPSCERYRRNLIASRDAIKSWASERILTPKEAQFLLVDTGIADETASLPKTAMGWLNRQAAILKLRHIAGLQGDAK